MIEININEFEDFFCGNAENLEGATGCTVILSKEGAVAGVDVRGSAPATRETDLLDPRNSVEKINAVILSGGSAYGLNAAAGVMEFLEERGIGFDVGVGVVPIVCGASLFDLSFGDSKCRPDKVMGYAACENAFNRNYKDGCKGAGTGATVGKAMGPDFMMKSGIGSYCIKLGDLIVGAIVAVNALGDVYDENGNFLSGMVVNGKRKQSVSDFLRENALINKVSFDNKNTTIGCILTNAKLDKAKCSKIAAMAHDGFSRVIKPVHTSMDGDCVFTVASGKVEVSQVAIESIAADVMEKAIINAVKSSDSMHGVKSHKEVCL